MNEQKEKNIESETNLHTESKDVINKEINQKNNISKDELNNEQPDNVSKKKNKKLFIGLIVSISIIFILIISSIIFALLNINNSKILSNITINGIDVSNKTKEEAITTITELLNNKISKNIDLTYPSIVNESSTTNTKDTELTFSSLEISYDINSAVEKAYNVGRSGNLIQNNFKIFNLIFKSNNIDLSYSFNDTTISSTLDNISSSLPNKVMHPSYYIEDTNLIITKGTAGNSVDKDTFINKLNTIFYDISSNDNFIDVPIIFIDSDKIDIDKIHSEVYKEAKNAYYEKDPFKIYSEIKGIDFDVDTAKQTISEDKDEYSIPLIITEPEISVEDLDIDVFPDLLGNFTTKYDASNTSRSTNLKLAASKINGIILSPGEEFSYNKIVGERTIEAGYKEAKIYSAGQVIDGLGGGICQISSTLYNAVIFANLNVTERHNHQFVTSYVTAGRDATVVYGAKDFKFVNNRTYPVKINLTVSDGIAKASIHGIKEETEYDINFSIENVSTINYTVQYQEDSSIPSGTEKIKQKGTNGIIVKDYKVTKLNGNIISKTLIAQDTYNAMARIILQGTGYVETPPDTTVDTTVDASSEPQPSPEPASEPSFDNTTETDNTSSNSDSNNTDNNV